MFTNARVSMCVSSSASGPIVGLRWSAGEVTSGLNRSEDAGFSVSP